MRRVREHRALGHRTILITGALDFAVEGLRPLFDEIVAAEMTRAPRRHATSGEMAQVPPTGETRAQILARLLRRRGPAPRGVRRLRRLDERPAAARGRRLPGRRQPGDPPGGDRPQAGLARRALGQGAAAARARCCRSARCWSSANAAGGSRDVDRPIGDRAGRRDVPVPQHSDRGAPMKALQVDAVGGRLGLARVASASAPAAAVQVGPLELVVDRPARAARRPGWHRVHTRLAGICGSDLSMVEGHASTYFDDWVSFPFVPGHEVVGRARRRHPGRARAGARPRGPRLRRRRSPAPRPATATTTPTSPPATSSPASRPASAARPAAAGRRGSSPTRPSCTASPTTCPTSGPCSSSRSPAASTPR